MEWTTLINSKRLGLENVEPTRRSLRSDFRRDYDRLVFSSPFRRLQNKTQVFPLPGSIFVHNRLTHSLEVSSVGRSMADGITERLRRRYHDSPATLAALDPVADIVAAACLAHDLGNPPFGHSGEKAIQAFFREGPGSELEGMMEPGQWLDFARFEGNANTFRLLTNRFNGRRPGGFAMTYSTLASIVKYPYESVVAPEAEKIGFFTSERPTMVRVAETLGLTRIDDPRGLRYARHPLVYIVEAADDICYEVMDIEDAHKLGWIGSETVIDLFSGFLSPERREHVSRNLRSVADRNEKIVYLRSCVIEVLVNACIDIFVDNEDAILQGTFRGSLPEHLPEPLARAWKLCEQVSWDRIYTAADVIDIELAGHRIITSLLDKLVRAVRFPDLNYSHLLLSRVPGQYDVHGPTLYSKVQAAIDHVSGMTDVYALDLYRKIHAMSLKINN